MIAKMKIDQEKLGFGFALSDMLVFGLFFVFAHYFVTRIDPLLFGGTAMLVGSLPLLFQLKLSRKDKDLYSTEFREPLAKIVILATLASLLFFIGTKMTSGINTGLLSQLEPFYALSLGVLFLGDRIITTQVLATVLMVIGAAIVVYKGAAGLNIGDILILISPLFYQISHVFAKRIFSKLSDVNVVPAARLFYGGLILTAIALILNPSSIAQLASIENLLSIVLFGLIFRCLDFVLWYQAIGRISVSKASALLPVSVGFSFFGSMIILGEKATTQQFLGLSFILVGLVWLSAISLRPSKP